MFPDNENKDYTVTLFFTFFFFLLDNYSAPEDVELYLQYYDLKRDPSEKDLLPVPLFSLVTLCALKQAGLTKETTSSKHFTQPSRSTYYCKKAGSFRKLGQISF